jgi:chloride channel protein, CIC family
LSTHPEQGSAAAPLPLMKKVPGLSLRTDQFEYVWLILLSVGVGILSAVGHFGFTALIDLCMRLFRGFEWNALAIPRGGFHLLLVPVVLMSGGVGMLILNYFFPSDVLGYGFPNFLEMVNLGNARIRRSWIFIKAAGAALSLGAGASVGREGPIAQIGGAIGSAVAQMTGLSVDRSKVLVAAGAGAGIAVTFNAPIGGLMFAQEIVLLGHTEISNLSLLIIATFSAVLTSRAMLGNVAIFHPNIFVLRSYWEMLTYTLMGASMGLLSAGYIRLFHRTAGFFRQLKIPQWAKLMIGLAAVGLIAIPLPQNLSDGYPMIDRALAGGLELHTMAALTLAKIVASCISLGCGAPGGVFGPIFFIGTMFGGTFRQTCAIFIPRLTGPRGSYALVGLAAFLSGVTHAPLTALFLLFEMTQDYQIALPAMIASIMALIVGRALEPESIDTYQLARAGKTLEIGRERLLLTQLPVRTVMTKDVDVVSAGASVSDVLHVAGNTPQATLPVIDSDGKLMGLIVTHDLLALFATGSALGPLINAYDISRQNPPVVTPESNLDEALQLMGYDALDELPVVERAGGGHFLGIVSRRAVAQALNRVSVSLSALATRDQSIFWASGYRVSRLQVPHAAEGKTLRELDPRARFNVTVLAVQDGGDPESGFAPIAPDRQLKSGDLIIAAGRSQELRRFARDFEQMSG